MEEQILKFNKRVLDTIAALDRVAARLARFPGRKSVIWISNGIPLQLDGKVVPGARTAEVVYLKSIDEIIARLNRADIAVYTVDARGLSTIPNPFLPSLKTFAERTGGTAFCQRNDLDEGVRLALEDDRISYPLGFTVAENAAPGLHELRVTTTRAGVRLRYRESYEVVW